MSDEVSIRITGDNTDFNAKIDQAKQKAKGLGETTGESLTKGTEKGSRAIDLYVKSLERAAANAGKSSREVKLEELAQRGATDEVIKRADAALRLLETQKQLAKEARAAAAAQRQKDAIADALAQSTKAARLAQYQRVQLGYQLNDFAVQVASGQSPITALIQQGSQLSGTFGGIGNAIRAVVGLINPLNAGLAALAATIGGVAYAYIEGERQAKAFADAVTKTGNFSGQTADQFTEMTRRIAASTGESVKTIREVASALLNTGQISQSAFSAATEAATGYARLTGKAAEDVAAEFARMADDPTKWATEASKTMHLFTSQQVDLIDSLQKHGKSVEAVSVIYEALSQRALRLNGNLNTLDSALKSAKNAWDKMWDAAINGDPDSIERKLKQAEEAVRSFNPLAISNLWNGGYEEQLAKRNDLVKRSFRLQENASEEATRAETRNNAIAVKDYIDGWVKKGKAASALKEELDKLNAAFKKREEDGNPIPEADKKAAISAVHKAFKNTDGIAEQKAKRDADIEDIRKKSEAVVDLYENSGKILEAQRAANLVSEQGYYAAKATLLEATTKEQERAAQAELDRLKQEKFTGKDRIDNLKKITDAEAKLNKVRQDGATAGITLEIQRGAALEKLKQQYIDAAVAAQSYLDTISRQNDRDVAGIGKGAKYRVEQGELTKIEDKFLARRVQLEGELRRNQIEPNQFAIELAVAEATYKREVELFEDRTRRIDAANEDMFNGMTEAFRNYADEAKNAAGMTAELFTDAFHSVEDALVTLGTTGKLSFKDLVTSIQGDLIRMGYRQLIGKGIEKFGVDLFGAGFGKNKPDAVDMSGAIREQLSSLTGNTKATLDLTLAAEAAAAALNALAVAGGGKSAESSAGGILGRVIGLFASFGGGGYNYTGDASGSLFSATGEAIRGRRAIGGPVSAGGMYQVNERLDRGPELLTVAGKQYLMTGDQGGKIEPSAAGKGGGDTYLTVNVTPPVGSTRETAMQFGATTGRQIQHALRRNG